MQSIVRIVWNFPEIQLAKIDVKSTVFRRQARRHKFIVLQTVAISDVTISKLFDTFQVVCVDLLLMYCLTVLTRLLWHCKFLMKLVP